MREGAGILLGDFEDTTESKAQVCHIDFTIPTAVQQLLRAHCKRIGGRGDLEIHPIVNGLAASGIQRQSSLIGRAGLLEMPQRLLEMSRKQMRGGPVGKTLQELRRRLQRALQALSRQ